MMKHVITVVGSVLFGAATFAAEPVTHSGRTITYRSDVKVEKVGDVEGHIRGTFKREGVTLHETGPRAGQISEIVIEGDFDMVNGLGAYQAKMFRTFANANTETLQIDGESKPKGVGVGTGLGAPFDPPWRPRMVTHDAFTVNWLHIPSNSSAVGRAWYCDVMASFNKQSGAPRRWPQTVRQADDLWR